MSILYPGNSIFVKISVISVGIATENQAKHLIYFCLFVRKYENREKTACIFPGNVVK